jgi:hypothetical protein
MAVLAIVVGGCAPPPIADDDGGTTEGGSEEDGGPCPGEWQLFSETPYALGLSSSHEDVFVTAGVDHLVVAQDGEWRSVDITEYEIPQIFRVWGSGFSDVWLLEGSQFNDNHRLWHYDGEQLVLSLETEDEVDLHDIWGAGPQEVWAVGERCDVTGCFGAAFRYDGNAWYEQSFGRLPGFENIWGSGPDDILLVAASHVTLHYDGEHWTTYESPHPAFAKVTGQDTDVFGYDFSNFYRWSGSSWETFAEAPVGVFDDYLDFEVFDRTVWVLGQNFDMPASLARYDGPGWTPLQLGDAQLPRSFSRVGHSLWVTDLPVPIGIGARVQSLSSTGQLADVWTDDSVGDVAALASNSVTEAFGQGQSQGISHLARFDGEGWSWFEGAPESVVFLDAWASGPGKAWAVGFGLETGLWKIEGDEIESADFPWSNEYLRRVWAGSDQDVWVVGDGGTYHFDGESWLEIGLPDNVSGDIRGSGGHVYYQSNVALFELQHGRWTELRRTSRSITGIDAAELHSVWLTELESNGQSFVMEYDGIEWKEHQFGDLTICTVDVVQPDDVYVSATIKNEWGEAVTVVLHYDGQTWTRIDTPSLSCPLLAATSEGIVMVEKTTTYVLECH